MRYVLSYGFIEYGLPVVRPEKESVYRKRAIGFTILA